MKPIVIAGLLLSLAGCAHSGMPDAKSPPDKVQSATINFNDPARGIHLEYPADWTEQAVPASGQILLIVKLPERANVNGFPPTLQVSTQTKGGTLQLSQIESAVIERGRDSLTGFQLVGNVPATLGGEPAKQIVYKGSSNGISIETMTTIAVHNGQGIAVSFASGPSEFGEHLPAVQRVLGSMTFTK